ncbi:unnamed protein product (macronuclear) [Paramecium tetraurelia]|uniref:Band 7 domain-containing protein n=1 Tax=Paramecium tetraurelia TaxID=5888 RepID=A0C190_PARTE|nr:uncharacterized protein GSPATT00034033001 [Paramecium tetraurelia]CAK64557.1 unnamed protein product [Paramecium tetraurelia]|eukprot:XP_001431955.1 hypothetical protein (macronuclear) [Paramecium tetraurelia strain d4-2]
MFQQNQVIYQQILSNKIQYNNIGITMFLPQLRGILEKSYLRIKSRIQIWVVDIRIIFIIAVCPCNPFVEYPQIQVEQSLVGVYLSFGKYIKIVQPGLIYINPCTDTIQKMIDCPRQQVMTKDNILVNIDSTVYYRMVIPRRSIFTQMACIRQQLKHCRVSYIVGSLGEESKGATINRRLADQYVWEWGIDIENMSIKDIQLNADLQNILSMVAKEQRAAQAKVISAQG